MIRNYRRAGALASVGVLFASLSGTGLAETLTDQTAQAMAQTPEVRFVAEPVIQALTSSPTPEPSQPAASLAELVGDMAPAELSPQVTCLAQAVYFEARGEPLDGQLAVARVIINRSESGAFPRDYCGVVAQAGQFSFVRGGRIPAAPTGSAAWQRAQAIARIADEDLWDSAAGASLYFHNSSVRPAWARSKATVARIDSHIFYR